MAGFFDPKALVKAAADAVCLLIAAAPAGLCRVEARFSERGDLFVLFGQAFSLVPGLPGNWLRRAFGRLTLDGCAPDCEIGFLSWFSSRHARIGARVYIGPLSVIGDAVIDELVELCWLEWDGGSLQVTATGGNICRQVLRSD